MRAKSVALLILALGCGLIASIGITQVMAKKNSDSGAPAGETEEVYVAMQDIDQGDPVTSDIIRLEHWPKGKRPEGVVTKLEDIDGRRCKIRIGKNSPIFESSLFAEGEDDVATNYIPDGYRVVTVKVDSVSSSGGLIRQGDRVDLIVHLVRNPSRGVMQTATMTFMEDVKVFAVNDVYSRGKDDDAETSVAARTISLLVTPEQALEVMLAAELGKIQLVMRNASDQQEGKRKKLSVEDLLKPGGKSDRSQEVLGQQPGQTQGEGKSFMDLLGSMKKEEPVKDVKTDAGPAQETKTSKPAVFSMRILTGSQVHDVTLQPSSNDNEEAAWTHSDAEDSQSALSGDDEIGDDDQSADDETETESSDDDSPESETNTTANESKTGGLVE